MSRHVLDEQVEAQLYQELRRRMSTDKVGDGFGQAGWKDDRICKDTTIAQTYVILPIV